MPRLKSLSNSGRTKRMLSPASKPISPVVQIIVYTIQFSKAQKRALTMIALTSDTFLSSFAFSLYAFYQRKTLRV